MIIYFGYFSELSITYLPTPIIVYSTITLHTELLVALHRCNYILTFQLCSRFANHRIESHRWQRKV